MLPRTQTIELHGTLPEQLCVRCDKQPPDGYMVGIATMRKTAAQDALTLFQALDELLPYGTWKTFLQICKMESEQLG